MIFFFRNKHDDPKFSLHVIIADMLAYIPSKFNTAVNIDIYFMRAGLRK